MQNDRRATLPRRSRLRGYRAFDRVFSQGKGFRRGEIVAKYQVRRSEDRHSGKQVSVGFVIRRSAGSAVRRNRLRRLLREAYRLQRLPFEGALPDGLALDMVLLWSGTPEQAVRPRFDAIRSDVETALRKILRVIHEQRDATAEEKQ